MTTADASSPVRADPFASGRTRRPCLAIGGRLAAAALLILGLKLRLILAYGSPFPAWDQWQAEGDRLIRPWLAGQLTLSDLVAPHNEHRILLTRLLVLSLFWVDQQWDALVEMTASALLHTGFAVALGVILLRRGGQKQWDWLTGALVLLFGLPFGWENTLNGFQSQFYFLLLTSTLTIWGLTGDHRDNWWPGLVGWGAAVLACFSMGSGALASLTVALWVGARLFVLPRGRRGGGEWRTLALTGTLFAVGCFLARPPGRGVVNPYASRTVGEFLAAFGNVLGWPNAAGPLMAIPAFLPFGCLAWRWVKRMRSPANLTNTIGAGGEPGRGDPENFLLSLGIWCILQAAALAWARGNFNGLARNGLWVSRYLDLVSVGVLVNFACLLHLVTGHLRSPWADGSPRSRTRVLALAALWSLLVIVGLTGVTRLNLANDLPYQASLNARGAPVLNAVLCTGDAGLLTDKTTAEVRCEDIALLGRLLTGQAPLRPTLLPDAVLPPGDLPPLPGWGERGWLSALTRRFLGWNGGMIFAGLAGWVLVSFLGRDRRPGKIRDFIARPAVPEARARRIGG